MMRRAVMVSALLALIAFAPAVACAQDAAALISTFRLANAGGKVTLDPTLTTIAREQADAMAAKATLDHDVLGDFTKRVAPANAGRAAENIAYGYDDFPRTLNQWINSPSHRKNLLLKDATKVGVASAKSAINKRTYWAMVIAGGYDKTLRRETKKSTDAPKSKAGAPCRMSVMGLCL